MSEPTADQILAQVCYRCAALPGEPCRSLPAGEHHPVRVTNAGKAAQPRRAGAVAAWNEHRGGSCARCRAAATGPYTSQRDTEFCPEGLALRRAAMGLA